MGRAYEMLVGLLEWMTERRKGCKARRMNLQGEPGARQDSARESQN